MLRNLKKRVSRLKLKSAWVFSVSLLGNTLAARLFLLGYGFLFVLIDPLRIRLQRPVQLNLQNRVVSFLFHGIIDYGLMEEIFVSDAYQLKKLPSKNIQSIIDIGSNSGVSSLYFRVLYPNARIYACEPNPLIFSQLQQNAKLIGNMTVHRLVISDHNGETDFNIDERSSVSSSIVKRGAKTVTHKLPSLSLEGFMNQNNLSKVDILKFDVEGSEELIFRGFTEFNRIDTVIGELHFDLCDAEMVKQKLTEYYPFIRIKKYSPERAYIIASKKSAFTNPFEEPDSSEK